MYYVKAARKKDTRESPPREKTKQPTYKTNCEENLY